MIKDFDNRVHGFDVRTEKFFHTLTHKVEVIETIIVQWGDGKVTEMKLDRLRRTKKGTLLTGARGLQSLGL